MKKLILLLLFIPLVSFGQGWTTFDNKPISEINTPYIQVIRIIDYRPMVAAVYYGATPYQRPNKMAIKKDGIEYKFNDIVEVINLFNSLGYELVTLRNSEGWEKATMYKRGKDNPTKNLIDGVKELIKKK